MIGARIRGGLAALVLGMVAVAAPATGAEEPAQAAALLARAASTLATRDWAGVYVQTIAGQSESFRIARRVEAGGDAERVEALEGVRREVVRTGDEVHRFLPERRIVRIERSIGEPGFPRVLPADPASLSGVYRLSIAGTGRVASRDAIIVRLQAIDALRYSREVWLDRETALPLKLRVLDATGSTLEQTAFSEVRVGARVAAAQVRPGRQASYAGWDVQTVTASLPQGTASPDPTRLGQGFRLLGGVMRRSVGEVPAATHWAFGDGLAVVSVFIEDGVAGSSAASPSATRHGALGVVESTVNGRRLTAIGEAPRALLERSLAAAGAALR